MTQNYEERLMFRLERLKSGDWQFGCDGQHTGIGIPGCPRERHHHHDYFCEQPTNNELRLAGVDPKDFRSRRRN